MYNRKLNKPSVSLSCAIMGPQNKLGLGAAVQCNPVTFRIPSQPVTTALCRLSRAGCSFPDPYIIATTAAGRDTKRPLSASLDARDNRHLKRIVGHAMFSRSLFAAGGRQGVGVMGWQGGEVTGWRGEEAEEAVTDG